MYFDILEALRDVVNESTQQINDKSKISSTLNKILFYAENALMKIAGEKAKDEPAYRLDEINTSAIARNTLSKIKQLFPPYGSLKNKEFYLTSNLGNYLNRRFLLIPNLIKTLERLETIKRTPGISDYFEDEEYFNRIESVIRNSGLPDDFFEIEEELSDREEDERRWQQRQDSLERYWDIKSQERRGN